jgi:hypothetical protein
MGSNKKLILVAFLLNIYTFSFSQKTKEIDNIDELTDSIATIFGKACCETFVDRPRNKLPGLREISIIEIGVIIL